MNKLNRNIQIIGSILLVLGAIDPLEGSVLIAIGSLTLALATYLGKDAQWKFFTITFILIAAGVGFLGRTGDEGQQRQGKSR